MNTYIYITTRFTIQSQILHLVSEINTFMISQDTEIYYLKFARVSRDKKKNLNNLLREKAVSRKGKKVTAKYLIETTPLE